jgi:hypothetical protein
MLAGVVLVRTEISEERIAFIIRVTRIGELGILAVISNRSMLRRNTIKSYISLVKFRIGFTTKHFDSFIKYEFLGSKYISLYTIAKCIRALSA